NAPAICAWDADLTYRELDQLATKLATQLVYSGLRPGMLVPLLFEKSAYTHVAQLAVLKAGGAFTTLPADLCPARIELIVGQLAPEGSAHLALGLCSPSLTKILAPLVSRVILVDEATMAGTPQRPDIGDIQVQPHDPAYVIFTSGTSGIPKGVVVEHRNICSSCRYFGREAMALHRPGVRHSQFLSYAFDGSIHEIFYTLANGGCLCVLSEDERLNDIAGAMTRMGVTHAKFTPSIAAQLAPEDFPTLQQLFLGGEPLTAASVDRWRPRVEVWNNYGPAECTVQSAVISCADSKWASEVVGQAGASRCWVVDPSNPHRQLPRGCIGEIVVEGPNVCRGYLRNPTDTHHAFVQGLSWAPSRRFYRTGDMGYLDSYGLLTGAGRNDDQVKINGQRIELGEVETRLQSVLPANSRGVVDVANPHGRGKVLVAFIQLSARSGPGSVEQLEGRIRKSLVKVLPPAFVPSRIFQVEEIPMGATGKTDRKTLRRLADELLTDLSDQIPAPCDMALIQSVDVGEKRRVLQQMWADTLQVPVETLHSHSDFFFLGGTSLLAMRLTALARKQSWDLSVQKIFAHPILNATLRQQIKSELLQPSQPLSQFHLLCDESSSHTLIWTQQTGYDLDDLEDVFPVTAYQKATFLDSLRTPGTCVLQTRYRLPETLNLQQFHHAWQQVCQRFPCLRTRLIRLDNGDILQAIIPQPTPLQTLHCTTLDDLHPHPHHSIQTMTHPGAPLNTGLLAHINHETHFIWTLHHAIFDGPTLHHIRRALLQAYHNTPWTHHPAPFPEYIHFLHTIPTTPATHFWTRYLKNSHPSVFPPHPYPRYLVRPHTTHRLTLPFPQTLPQSHHSITTATLLHATWALTLASFTRTTDITYQHLLSGRTAPTDHIDQIAGPTIALVPVRMNL
ncbi:acetyl-CoA synthetase-like protein, partial [Aspergillus ibericus CBS 121593]